MSRIKASRGGSNFTIATLAENCQNPTSVPEDVNEAFILDFKTNNSGEFNVVWSTKKLLSFATMSVGINLDGTYKLNWSGFPSISFYFFFR